MALLRLVFLALYLSFVLHNVVALPGRNRNKGRRNGGGRRSKKVAATKKNGGGGGGGGGPVTCPGYAGYCSESYPGQTCLVVCAFGRNNVPVCQEDGTWTAEPRCIEHEPGREEQVPGQCPGVPGYCSLDLPGGLCTFECARGPHIRSSCLPDGTWEPYPTCDGDVRETKDGCDPCPGPFGGPRNRTAEAGGSGGVRPSNGGSRNGSGARPSSGGNRNGGGARPSSGGNRGSSRTSSQVRNSGGNRGTKNKRKNNGGKRRNSGGNRRNQGGQKRNGGSNRRQQSNNRKTGGGGGAGGCPDSVLEACIDACPGSSTKIFGACVAGCSKRCQR